MTRSGPGFPAWAFAGFCIGVVCGAGLGYVTALATKKDDTVLELVLASFMAGGCAAGGAVVGGVRDVLAFLDRRLPTTPHDPRTDYREPTP